MRWSVEEKDELRRLLQAGMTNQQIADKMGKTRNTVAGGRHRYCPGVAFSPPPKVESAAAIERPVKRAKAPPPEPPKFRWTPERDARLKVLAFEGQTPKQIANDLGALDQGVRRRIRELGIEVRHSPVVRKQSKRSGREVSTVASIPAAENPFGHSIMGRFAEGYRGQRGRIPIDKLTEHHCHYPIETAKGLRYCGATRVIPHTPYCEEHALRCYERLPVGKGRR